MYSPTLMPNLAPLSTYTARAVVYIRVSTDRQVVEGASLQTQERDCYSMCERNGWEVVRLFREEGESAKVLTVLSCRSYSLAAAKPSRAPTTLWCIM